MLTKKNSFMFHNRAIVLVLVSGMICAGPLAASTIEIQFTGLDIEYVDDAIINVDPGLGDPDPLNTVTFLLDGVVVGSLMTDISIELSIPSVVDIDIAGDTVASATGGIMDFDFGGGDFLDLDLGSVSVTYVDILGIFQFAFGGSAADVVGQSLPFGLSLDGDVSVSFSTQISPGSLIDDGTFITEFAASGTGEIEGIGIPEPTTLALAMLGLISISRSSLSGKNSLR
ncbi:MAG: PEP-CTERM sorting domain-containing protein [Planctomycetes bacterium]|nr:PEP-CTERM sorting domain-containing protein [Planctomycetota bacterium]